MSAMDPCPECGGKVKATLAPLWGFKCPGCKALYLPESKEEMGPEQLRALIDEYAEAFDAKDEKIAELEKGFNDRGEWLTTAENRVTAALGKVAFYGVFIQKLADDLGIALTEGNPRLQLEEFKNGVIELKAKAEKAEKALLHITQVYDARSELYTNDADLASNMASFARRALG